MIDDAGHSAPDVPRHVAREAGRDARHDGSVLTPDVDVAAAARAVGPDAAEPDLAKTGAAVASLGVRSANLTILTALAVLYTLYFAREFLLPIVFALLLSFLLSPVVRAFARVRIPPPLGAGLIVLTMLGVLGSGAFGLSGAVRDWATTAPRTLATAEAKLGKILKPLQRASKTAEQVANGATTAAAGAGAAGAKPAAVVVEGPSLAARVFGTTQRSIASILEVLILLYFLLASGDLFLQKLIKVLPNLGEKRKAVQIARETESSISTYLLTATVLNVGEGLVVTGVMYLWGMPTPALWGALVVLFEYIPYLGALSMVVILTVAAVTTFDSVGHALLVPTSFLLINLIQGNLVAPLLLGHRLSLNPVALFVGLAFWFWIWGVPGAFIAVPLLATFKIFCDHIESLASIGEFLGQRDEQERRASVRLRWDDGERTAAGQRAAGIGASG
ncbi:AI-2E family transporter [Gemmatimonadetes bacterium T265]|nr:AI-2E family transporter [Gemmatimonadetes bacterium T265]